jgi:excisionase family DNA binding protein
VCSGQEQLSVSCVATVAHGTGELGVVMAQNTSMSTDLLTVAEIAASMRVSKMTVYRLMRSGAMQSIRFGRSYRVPKVAVQRYLESVTPGR